MENLVNAQSLTHVKFTSLPGIYVFQAVLSLAFCFHTRILVFKFNKVPITVTASIVFFKNMIVSDEEERAYYLKTVAARKQLNRSGRGKKRNIRGQDKVSETLVYVCVAMCVCMYSCVTLIGASKVPPHT